MQGKTRQYQITHNNHRCPRLKKAILLFISLGEHLAAEDKESIKKLQSAQNFAAMCMIISGTRKFDHVTQVFKPTTVAVSQRHTPIQG